MKSKVMFSLLLIGSIFLLGSTSVNAQTKKCYLLNDNNICISEENYNNLISLGFTDFEIRTMTKSEYNKNVNLSGQVVATTDSYYRVTYYYDHGMVKESNELITEDEYNNLIVSTTNNGTRSYDGYTETNGKKMTCQIVLLSNGKMRYKNTLVWKSVPSTRSYDIITIGMEGNKVHYSANRSLIQTYCYGPSACTSDGTAVYKTQTNGVGAVFKLPEGSVTYLQAYFYYDVVKNSGVGTITSLYAYGDYAHATSNVTQSQADGNYNIGTGVILSTNITSYYDSMSTATANWTGSW